MPTVKARGGNTVQEWVELDFIIDFSIKRPDKANVADF